MEVQLVTNERWNEDTQDIEQCGPMSDDYSLLVGSEDLYWNGRKLFDSLNFDSEDCRELGRPHRWRWWSRS